MRSEILEIIDERRKYKRLDQRIKHKIIESQEEYISKEFHEIEDMERKIMGAAQ